MNGFDDKELAALESELEPSHNWTCHTERADVWKALIARLKASERGIMNLLTIADSAENHDAIVEALREWRESRFGREAS